MPQIRHQGQTYIVAKPGEAFHVRVRRHGARALTPGEVWECSLSIDGKNIGYHKVLRPSPIAGPQCYEGIVKGFITAPGVRKPFEFATVSIEEEERQMQRPNDDGPNSTNIKVGTISVETLLRYECGRKKNGPTYRSSVASADTSKLGKSKGKKALFSPSLSTAAGEGLSDPSAFMSAKKYTEVPGTRKGPLVINYQTENVLLLRKVLDPTVPEHLALTSYAQQADVKDEEEEVVPDVQIVPTGSPPSRTAKKRPAATTLVDLTGKYARSSSIAQEPIDLTGL